MFRRLWWQHPSIHKTKGLAWKPISGTPPPPSFAGRPCHPPPQSNFRTAKLHRASRPAMRGAASIRLRRDAPITRSGVAGIHKILQNGKVTGVRRSGCYLMRPGEATAHTTDHNMAVFEAEHCRAPDVRVQTEGRRLRMAAW